MVRVPTSLRDPGPFGWAGSFPRRLTGHPAWVKPCHVPFSVPGLGVRTRAAAGAGLCAKAQVWELGIDFW